MKGRVESGAVEIEAAKGWALGEGRADSGTKGRGEETVWAGVVQGSGKQIEVGKERNGGRWKQGLADRDGGEGVFE